MRAESEEEIKRSRGDVVKEKDPERWRELAEIASKEQNTEKLMELTKQNNEILNENHRSKHKPCHARQLRVPHRDRVWAKSNRRTGQIRVPKSAPPRLPCVAPNTAAPDE
jgi:hypothetical protein